MDASPCYAGVVNDSSCTRTENSKPLRCLLEEGRKPSYYQRRERIEPALLEDLWKMDVSPSYGGGVANDPSCCTRPGNSKPLPRLLEEGNPSYYYQRRERTIEPSAFLLEGLWKMDASPSYGGVADGPSCTRPENSKPIPRLLEERGRGPSYYQRRALLLEDLWKIDAYPPSYGGVADGPSCYTRPENSKPIPRLLEERGGPSYYQRRALLLEDLGTIDVSPSYGGVANDPSCTIRPENNSNPLRLHHPTTTAGAVVISFITPCRLDVLFGKGRAYREHAGNVRANNLVAMALPKYEQACKYEKTDMARLIVNMINESHGRFLKFDENGGCWVEVEDDVAREKISHIFRNRRDRNKRNYRK
jgi:hypothetical protein